MPRLGLLLALLAPLAAQEKIQVPHEPALAPDGSKVAFSWRDDIWIAEAEGGLARRLTFHPARDTRPLFSPDGKAIAFASTRSGRYPQVYVMDLEGGEARQVTFHSEGCMLMDWYPDARSLLVLGVRDQTGERRKAARLFRVPVRRGPERLVFDTYVNNFGAAVDGRGRVLFTREGERSWRKGYRGALAAQIWLYDQGAYQRLVEGEHECRWPFWLPGGKEMLYTSQESGTFNLWKLDLEEGSKEQLTRFEGDGVMFPSLSRDGTKVLFRRLLDLHMLDLGTGQIRQLDLVAAADGPEEPIERSLLKRATDVSFTADGKQTAFVAGRVAWVMDAELKEPVRITPGAAPVGEVCFLPGGEGLFYSSLEGGEWDLWLARPADPTRWWWLNTEFRHRRLTATPGKPSRLRLSPDGKRLAYLEGRGELWILEVKGEERHKLHGSWAPLDHEWSPCGKWIAFSQADPEGGYAVNVWLLRSDGSAPPVNISRHPNRDSQPAWSPDGKKLAWVTRRAKDEADLCWIYLRVEDERLNPWDRRMEKALQGGVGPTSRPASKPATRRKAPETVIDFEKIQERIRRIAIPGGTERDPFWDPGSTTLFFRASLKDGTGLCQVRVEPSTGQPARVAASLEATPVWLPGAKAFGTMVGGSPALFTPPNKVAARSFSVAVEEDLRARLPYVFDEAWRLIRDHFYDGRLNNLDWYAVRDKYRPAASGCLADRELQELVNLMLGELNASHMGFTPSRQAGARPPSASSWTETTWHLGLIWEEGRRGPGLKVKAVIPRGPADRARSRIHPGETVLRIDRVEVGPASDMTTVLNRPDARPFQLEVVGKGGKVRTVELLPISYAAARSLLFQQRLRDRKERVESLSEGRLGYLVIEAMSMQSFEKFQEDLYAAGHGKQGLVIDVRDNGGGSTTDLLLTALCQPEHAFTIPRGAGEGYPRDRFVYPRWEKPIVVLCNQWSYSNAEIFSHAVQALGRGRIVGVPTAGGVISTGAASVLGMGTLRMPGRGWFLPESGLDMERNGCVPDLVIWLEPGDDIDVALDRQLDKAVEVLLEDVQAWLERPRPRARYASEEAGE